MQIKCEILADSINPLGVRLTSFLLEYPRFIHAELMTHRVFSRNASSSRAIPIQKMIERVHSTPALPVYWGKNKPGMSADEELTRGQIDSAINMWHDAAQAACDFASGLADIGVHKQLANRVLEPFSMIQVVLTTAKLNNFFGRRAHEKAQPEFQLLAYTMLGETLQSTPDEVDWGGWHLPFNRFDHPTYAPILNEPDPEKAGLLYAKVVTARCARASYMNFDGTMDLAKDLELHDSLLADLHVSPFEHPCKAVKDNAGSSNLGVYTGWQQYRKMIPAEDGEHENPQKIWDARPEWIKKLLEPEERERPVLKNGAGAV